MNAPMKKKLLFVLRHAPYGNSLAKEALDAILATSAYDQDLSIVFLDDGVFQLLKSQQAELIEEKNIINILSAFPFYEINNLFVCQHSLQVRGIDKTTIIDHVCPVDHIELTALLANQDHLLSF